MSNIEHFAELVETFNKAPKVETLPTTKVASIKCLAASFDGLVVDFGAAHSPRFEAQVVKRTATTNKIIWALACRSQKQAQTDAEDACRSFAANEGYTS